MLKEFNNLEEMQKYYDEKTNTYVFKENDDYFDVRINFDLDVKANIDALDINTDSINVRDIDAFNINALNIKAGNIDALNINAVNIDAGNIDAVNIDAWDINAVDIEAVNIDAMNISFYAICASYYDIICNKCEGRRENAVINTLHGKLIIKENNQNDKTRN